MHPTPRNLDQQPAPLLISDRNAEAMTGRTWRWCRTQARRLGVPELRVGGRVLIRAAELLEALEADAVVTTAATTTPEPTPDQRERAELADMRRALRMVGGAHG